MESKYAEMKVEIDVHVAAAVKAYREQVEVLERKLSGKGRARPPPEATNSPVNEEEVQDLMEIWT